VTTEVTLVDTNILLDLVTNDTVWVDWSQRQLEAAAVRGAVLINDVVYAELAVGFLRVEEVDATLAAAQVEVTAMPREALFLAGKVFQRYRAGGGTRSGVLPDFFIGAHAAVAQLPLLTRDVRRYRTYFPTVQLIAPTD
jgi:predicted nucleic acid-binding protein